MSAPWMKNYCSHVPVELFIIVWISLGLPLKCPRRLDTPQGTDQTFLLQHTPKHTHIHTMSYSIYRSVYNNTVTLYRVQLEHFLHEY